MHIYIHTTIHGILTFITTYNNYICHYHKKALCGVLYLLLFFKIAPSLNNCSKSQNPLPDKAWLILVRVGLIDVDLEGVLSENLVL